MLCGFHKLSLQDGWSNVQKHTHRHLGVCVHALIYISRSAFQQQNSYMQQSRTLLEPWPIFQSPNNKINKLLERVEKQKSVRATWRREEPYVPQANSYVLFTEGEALPAPFKYPPSCLLPIFSDSTSISLICLKRFPASSLLSSATVPSSRLGWLWVCWIYGSIAACLSVPSLSISVKNGGSGTSLAW